MILRPPRAPSSAAGFVSAWQAIANTQKTTSTSYHLVRQPDHARLAGHIAGHLSIPGASAVDDDIVRGISLHDEGWTDFDCGRERLQATAASYSATNAALNAEGKPLSFLEIKAGDFLRAWRGSIESAEAVAPIAGLMVSGHFRRIGQFGMNMGTYSAGDTRLVRKFIAQEEDRERRLLGLQSRSEEEVRYWIDVLQFCDLLSLYLCCGSEESVEFPQPIGPNGETARLQGKDGVYALSRPIFIGAVELDLEADPYPAAPGTSPVRLKWRVG